MSGRRGWRGPGRRRLRAPIAAFAGVIVIALLAPHGAAGQVISPFIPLPPPDEPADTPFFPRFDGRIAMEALATGDDRFSWDGDFGAGLDVVDAARWRASVFANVEVIFGRQLQRFDPIQGNYTIEIQGARRTGPGEVSAFFHHQSRHLGDRPKDFQIAWNVLGGQYAAASRAGVWETSVHGRAGWVVNRSFVDYRLIWSAGAGIGYRTHPRVRLGLRGGLAGVAVERELFGRGAPIGGRLEAGVEISGAGAAVEILAAYERRIDADALRPGPERWGLVGLRISAP